MSFFNSGFFWFFEGILACLAFMGFRAWMEDRNVPMPVWKWLLLGLWVLLLGVTIAFVGTSLGENEPVAAGKGGLVFGLITLISGVGLWRLINLKPKNK